MRLESCPQCGGLLYFLGALGLRDRYRCRSCGHEVSHWTEELNASEARERLADQQEAAMERARRRCER